MRLVVDPNFLADPYDLAYLCEGVRSALIIQAAFTK